MAKEKTKKEEAGKVSRREEGLKTTEPIITTTKTKEKQQKEKWPSIEAALKEATRRAEKAENLLPKKLEKELPNLNYARKEAEKLREDLDGTKSPKDLDRAWA
ncbi:MAG: hypothetical protein QXS91_00915 [Candidatus Anstonellales archaeon]